MKEVFLLVYFIADLKNETVKIGYTKNNPLYRVKQLQTANGNRLNLIGWIEGGRDKEKELHKQFSKSKNNLHMEWFCLDADIIGYINENNKMSYSIERVDGRLFPLFKMKLVCI